jgi:hypothetical protein
MTITFSIIIFVSLWLKKHFEKKQAIQSSKTKELILAEKKANGIHLSLQIHFIFKFIIYLLIFTAISISIYIFLIE